jgi:iron complex transport system substrate-binding protein
MAPSNTELLYAIGAQDKLLAVCTQCDEPKAASALPKAGNFEKADLEKLAAIRPQQVFLVNGQEMMQSTIENQRAFDTKVHVLTNDNMASISKNLVALGEATQHIEEAKKLATKFDQDVEALRKLCASSGTQPKVFFCVWPEPLVTIGRGSYLSDAVTICGGKNIAANLEAAYPRFSVERLMLEQPDVIIMPDEASRDIFSKPPWTSLTAVKNKRIYFLPPRKADTLSRPTLRSLEGLHWLAERIHPELSKSLSMSKNSIRHLSATTAGNR